MRTFAIGDIHGCLVALRTLDQHLNFSVEDTVITLGDYVDRGPSSCGVLEYLIALRQRCKLIMLRGNHEVMMLDARTDQRALLSWMINGGDATLESYGEQAQGTEAIPQEHWAFLEQTLPYYEPDKQEGAISQCFFVHANAHPKKPLSKQDDTVLYWHHLDPPRQSPHVSGKRMICGHTSQKSGKILALGEKDDPHTVCIDTWACGGKWLTCLDVETLQYWQANEAGKTREGSLSKQ